MRRAGSPVMALRERNDTLALGGRATRVAKTPPCLNGVATSRRGHGRHRPHVLQRRQVAQEMAGREEGGGEGTRGLACPPPRVCKGRGAEGRLLRLCARWKATRRPLRRLHRPLP